MSRLRYRATSPAFRIVLVEPEIPPNTGAIARTCAATQSALHLVGKLGFRIDEHAVRRAGLDYWHLVDLHRHATLNEFLVTHPSRFFLLSAHGQRSYLDARFEPGDALVFGKESVGLPTDVLDRYADRTIAIPTAGGVRSLNLSNAVAVVLYEALRQTGALDAVHAD